MLTINSPGGRSLRLMHAAVEDAGRYTCIVSNAAGEERKNFDLEILGKFHSLFHLFLCTFVLLNGSKLLKMCERNVVFINKLPVIPQSHQASNMRGHSWTPKSRRNTTLHSPVRCQVKVYTATHLC